MKSAATFALCALFLGYCSHIRGDHHVTTPASLPVTPTSPRGDGETVQESTAVLPQRPSPTLNSSAAVALHSTPASANKSDEQVASASTNASASANASGNTDAAHSAAPPLLPIGQSSTVAPALKATNAAAVPTAGVGASGTPQTGSVVSTTTSATNPPTILVSAGNQTQASKEADPSSKDNSTLSTSPSSSVAPATAGPPPTTKPTEVKAESASPTTTTAAATTIMPATAPMTTAATTISQSSSSPVPGHKKPTGNSTPSRSSAITSPTTSTTTTTTASATTASRLSTSATTTSPPAPGHPTQPALSELNVGDDDNSKGVPDPLLAGLVSVFVVAAAIVSLLVFLKFRKRNERPEFRRLQDLPMDDMMEDTPLSMYSY